MTKEEFLQKLSKLGWPRAEIEAKQLVAAPCGCGNAGCPGWRLIRDSSLPENNDLAKEYLARRHLEV